MTDLYLAALRWWQCRSNCLLFACAVYLARRRAWKRRFADRAQWPHRYLVPRRSDWGLFPHVAYGEERASGLVRTVGYKPVAPKKRLIPPPLFRGYVAWGDKKRGR